MRRHFDEMHEEIAWERRTGGDPEIPGLDLFEAVVSIPGRKEQAVETITEDKVSNVQFTLPPQYEVFAGDRLDGATVLEVASPKDVRGRVIRWIAYARQ